MSLLDNVQWGTVGEWASALAAVAVIAVTLAVWRSDHRRQERAAERAEAAGVHCWFDYVRPTIGHPSEGSWRLVVDNRSDLVLYRWEAAAWWVRMGAPGTGPHVETWTMSDASFAPLAPGRQVELPISSDVLPPHPARDMDTAIIWQHPTGTWWKRTPRDLVKNESGWPLPWAARPQASDPDAMREAMRALDKAETERSRLKG